MIQPHYIFIGGSKHGKIGPSFGCPRVKVALPRELNFLVSDIFDADSFPEESYELRQFCFGGSTIRHSYMVLASLGNYEAERLVERFENEPEPPTEQPITRL